MAKVADNLAVKKQSVVTELAGYGIYSVNSSGDPIFKKEDGSTIALGGSAPGANTTLSNLSAPTAINQDLLASGTRNLGNNSSGIWENTFTKNITVYNSSATPLSMERVSTSPGKWDFVITSDPAGTGEIFIAGSLGIVGRSSGRVFSVRAGDTGLPQFRVNPSFVEVVGNDSTNGYQLKINNVNANPANYISQISHSNSYQGTEYYFGGTEYAWLNVTGNSHSTPAFMQIANDINATNSRIGIRVVGVQKAIFKQNGIIFNPNSLTDTSTSPVMFRDVSGTTGEALKIEGDSGKDTSFWINQPASNKYFSVGGQAGSYSMWMAYCGTSHPTQPSRAFLAFDDPNGILGIRANNTTKFTVTYAGNIGIGDNFYNPTSLLHLKGVNPELKIEASSNSAYFKIVSFGTNQEAGISLKNSANEYGDMYFYGSTHSNVNLRDRMILSKATGGISLHVGTYTKLHTTVDGIAIGTDHLTPSYLLHVKHNAQTMAMFENTSTDAYVRVNSPANKTSNVIFTAGTNVADFGLTGESHGIPNVFSFYVPLNVKFRNYLNGVFHHQLSLSSTYSRFSIGLNYETSAIFGIKRMAGDTANSFNIEDSSGNNQIVVDSSGNLILGANTSTYKLYVNHGVGSADRVHIGNGTYGLFFGNASASGYSPYIYGLANTNGSPAIYWIGYSQISDDTGTNPVISLDARRVGDTSITTRPIFSLANNGSKKLEVSSTGIINVYGNILANSTGYDIGSSSVRLQNIFINGLDISPLSSKPSLTLGNGLATTPVNGAIEYDSSNGFYITHGSTRKLIATNSSVSSNKYRGVYGLFYVDIDNTTDILTVDSGLTTASKLTYDLLDTGDGILFDTLTLPTGINNTTIYYIRRISSTTFSLHPTKTDAINNTNKVDITGSTNLTDRPLTVREFNLKGNTTLIGKTSTGSIVNAYIPSSLSDLDTFEIDYKTGSNGTTLELTLDATNFANGQRFVSLVGNSEFQVATTQTISIGNQANAFKRILVQYKAAENYVIVHAFDYA